MTATAKTVSTCRDILDKLATKNQCSIRRIVSDTAKYNPAELAWDEGDENHIANRYQHVTSAQMRYLMVHRLIEVELTAYYNEYFRLTDSGRAALEEGKGSDASKQKTRV